MKQFKAFFTILAFSIVGFSTLQAESVGYRQNSQKEEQPSDIGKGAGYGIAEKRLPMGYNAPAKINAAGCWDAYFSGTFLYFIPFQDQMDIGIITDTTTTPDSTTNLEQETCFKPGFRLAAGCALGNDDWAGYVDYMRYHMSTRVHFTPVNQTLVGTIGWLDATGFSSATTLRNLKTQWKLNLDLASARLYRTAYTGRMVTLKAYIGPQGGKLDQKMISVPEFTAGLPVTNTTTSDSWLLGAKVGLDTKWLLGKGFRFLGNLGTSLLYQEQTVKGSYTNTNNTALILNLNQTVKRTTPILECVLGTGWGCYLMNDSYHFDLSASYEFSYLWGQNVIRAVSYANHNVTRNDGIPIKAGDLSLQGFTLTGRFDF